MNEVEKQIIRVYRFLIIAFVSTLQKNSYFDFDIFYA